jgi:MFS transporter, MHS family, shikimate and dehydroshikimate transport protein
MSEADTANQVEAKSVRRVAVASLIGTSLEYYDYFIFGTASALVFSKVFFPELSPTGGALASFAIFAVSFIVRPIGAVVFGHFGDRIGRKRLTILTILLMGAATFGVGLVPSVETVGVLAPVLLVLARILQGLGVSGEWGGAVLLAVEHAPKRLRGFYGSFPMMGLSVGLFLGTAAFFLLDLMPDEQFLSWGWRIPFLLSIVLVLVALYIRLNIDETPAFKAAQSEYVEQQRRSLPIVETLRHHWRSVLKAMGLKLAGDVQGYIVTAFLTSYLVTTLHKPGEYGTLAVAIAALLSVVAMPMIGRWSDRIGRRPILIGSALLGVLVAFPFFWLVDTGSLPLIVVATVLVYTFAVQGQGAVLGTVSSELFPARVRYTGISVAYQFGGIIGGGPAALIATALISASAGASWTVALYMVAIGLVTLVAALLTGETLRHRPAPGGVRRTDGQAPAGAPEPA